MIDRTQDYACVFIPLRNDYMHIVFTITCNQWRQCPCPVIPHWCDGAKLTAGALWINLDVHSGSNITTDRLGLTFPVVWYSQAENLNILI